MTGSFCDGFVQSLSFQLAGGLPGALAQLHFDVLAFSFSKVKLESICSYLESLKFWIPTTSRSLIIWEVMSPYSQVSASL